MDKLITVKGAAEMTLPQLASAIKAEHAECISAKRTALILGASIGRKLNAAKEKVEHGEWTAWLNECFDGGERTAQRYMQAAREYETCDKSALKADLGLTKFLLNVWQDKQQKRVAPIGTGSGLRGLNEPPPLRIRHDEPEEPAEADEQPAKRVESKPAKKKSPLDIAIAKAKDHLLDYQQTVKNMKRDVGIDADLGHEGANPIPEFAHIRIQPLMIAIDQVFREFKWGMPAGPCPYHDDDPTLIKNCKKCHGVGWLAEEKLAAGKKDLRL